MAAPPSTPYSAISTTSETSLPTPSDALIKAGSQKKKGRTKVIYFWRSEDVNKWLRKHCGLYHQMYGDTFIFHDINGRSLMRLSDSKLEMMGIQDQRHREDLMRHILRLKLKTEAQDLKTLDQKNTKI